jgi:hypothetical protein
MNDAGVSPVLPKESPNEFVELKKMNYFCSNFEG